MNTQEFEAYWNSFFTWLSDKGKHNVFRGVSNNEHLLLPSVGRRNYSLEREINLFSHFKFQAVQYKSQMNDFEWLATAQHYGLPTRLMDWTYNPLVAAYFACLDNETDGIIYTTTSKSFYNLQQYPNPFMIYHPGFIFPPINTTRISLQKGVFSIHPRPDEPVIFDDNGFLIYINRSDKYHVDKDDDQDAIQAIHNATFCDKDSPVHFTIPKNLKNYFLQKIKTLGIDELIFGDLDAVSRYLANQTSLPQIEYLNPDLLIPTIMKYVEAEFIDYYNVHRTQIGMGFPYNIPKQKNELSLLQKDAKKVRLEYKYSLKLCIHLRDLKPYFISVQDTDDFIENILRICAKSKYQWCLYKKDKRPKLCNIEVDVTYKLVSKTIQLDALRISTNQPDLEEHCRAMLFLYKDELQKSELWPYVSERMLTDDEVIVLRRIIGLDCSDWN